MNTDMIDAVQICGYNIMQI